jgi:hypothetical protein
MPRTGKSIANRLKSLFAPLIESKVEVEMFAYRLDVFAIRLIHVDAGKAIVRNDMFEHESAPSDAVRR